MTNRACFYNVCGLILHPVDAWACEHFKANLHLSVKKIFMGENGSPHPPTLRLTSVYPGHALIPRTPRRTPAGIGFVLHGPRVWGGLAAGAGGRQAQAPSAMDSSSALAESARERPELGMTPVSKVPHGFIRRPKLRFPSPLNFPALLFFWTCFSN